MIRIYQIILKKILLVNTYVMLFVRATIALLEISFVGFFKLPIKRSEESLSFILIFNGDEHFYMIFEYLFFSMLRLILCFSFLFVRLIYVCVKEINPVLCFFFSKYFFSSGFFSFQHFAKCYQGKKIN